MTLLDRLLGRPQHRFAKAVTALGPWATDLPLSVITQEPQQRAAKFLRAYKVGWFYKAGRKIADDVSALDWSVSLGDVEEAEAESTLPRPDLREDFASLSPIDQFQRLLERPNPYQTGRQMLRKTQVRLDFAGCAAWYLEGATSGLPTALYGVSPARLWPSYDSKGRLIGWVLDKDKPSGGVPFDAAEILWFTTGNADNDDIWGVSVVEAVYSQVPLTDLIARHTGDTLALGGRLSGMLWPKERALNEGEYLDAQRAWRNVASDPNAARRMLIFPEPMEWSQGAATPEEIGIPELATLNRDEILTAFPVNPYRLGVPTPSGFNASGEVKREERRDYWEETIHPRADLLEETIQVGLVALYEKETGQTFDFEIAEPNLDDAPSLMEKTAAWKGLVSIGLDPKESLGAVGLDHIKWLGPPQPVAPEEEQQRAVVQDESRRDNTATQQVIVGKAAVVTDGTTEDLTTVTSGTGLVWMSPVKARGDIATAGAPLIGRFLSAQRDRVVEALRSTLPASKAARREAIKGAPAWWDNATENAELLVVFEELYQDTSRQSLQVVADTLGRIIPNKAVSRVTDDLLSYGGSRISGINARTLEALTAELAEGTRRGYSVVQLIDGVPDEGFSGVLKVGLDNGVGVWSDARAEMIARTETALSYNRATLDGYREFQVAQVQAIDGDTDAECAARNGQLFSLDDAFGIADHPNGTLDWVPVLGEKSAHLTEPDVTADELRAILREFFAETKAQAQIVPISPQITFNPTIQVPEQPPPIIRNEVTVPEIKMPDIVLPEQPRPIVTVKAAPAPEVQNIRIVGSPARLHRREVKRERGVVTEVIEQSADLLDG